MKVLKKNMISWGLPFVYGLLSMHSVSAQPAQAITDAAHIRGFQPVAHYTRGDFKSHPRIYGMCEDKEGILYFGNDEGILIFDGEVWKKVRLPNGSTVRSVWAASDGRIYAGGYGEFGIINRNPLGEYEYESITHLLRPEDRNTENIWAIHEAQGYLIFRAHKVVIALHGNKAFKVPAEVTFAGSFVVNDRLFVRDGELIKQLDLSSLESGIWFTPSDFNGETLLTILPGNNVNEHYGVTREGSLYAIGMNDRKTTFLSRILDQSSGDIVTCALTGLDGKLYVGTLRSKVMTSNLQALPITFQKLDDIQNNIVNDITVTMNGNIWVTLDAGIDCISAGSPASVLLEGVSVYDVTFFKNRLYVASNQGVHVSKPLNSISGISRNDFDIIPGLEGRGWSFTQAEGKLLCSHDKGVFELNETGYKYVEGTPGIWKVIPIRERPHDFLACGYEGLYLLKYSSGGFRTIRKLEGFNESTRDILQEQPGGFWVCHGYKGVFYITIDKEYEHVFSVEHFTDENGLPSKFENNVSIWQNDIVFTTNGGVYTYDKQSNRFDRHPFLTSLFGSKLNVRKIFERENLTWFVHGDEAGYFGTRDKEPKLNKDLFLELKGQFIQSMECVVPIDSNRSVLVGTNFGLYLFDLHAHARSREVNTRFSAIQYVNSNEPDSIIRLPLASEETQLTYQARNIAFWYSAPGLKRVRNVQYSTILEGLDEEWSEWQENPRREWSLLRPGEYTFRVKTRSLIGENSREARYRFEILPAWYQTRFAYFMYFVGGSLFVYGLVNLTGKKIQREREKARAEEMEKRRLLELELERMRLVGERDNILKDKELLEDDLVVKSKELVNYTMLMVKKKELLTEIHDDLKEMKDQMKNESGRQLARSLIRKINQNLANEEHFKVFQTNFEKVHEAFFERLRYAFHDLTTKELHLSAFVRMNLTNKEIASILNISVRGVETARYRLRKRLGIAHEEDMARFFEKLYSERSIVSPR